MGFPGLTVEGAFAHGVDSGAAFEHFEPVGRHQYRAAGLVEAMVGAADALQQAGRSLRRADLDHQIDRRPVDLHIDRDVRGVKKRIDIGAVLVNARVGLGQRALDEAGLAGDLLPVTITLRLGGKTTPRPGEVLRALTGIKDLHPRVVRSEFFALRQDQRAAPLQLELLRGKTPLQAAE